MQKNKKRIRTVSKLQPNDPVTFEESHKYDEKTKKCKICGHEKEDSSGEGKEEIK
jgi:hypothetical protein